MKKFVEYLQSVRMVPEKQSPYYAMWVSNFYNYVGQDPEEPADIDDINRYLRYLQKSKEDWQIKQAKEAIGIYQYYIRRTAPAGNEKEN